MTNLLKLLILICTLNAWGARPSFRSDCPEIIAGTAVVMSARVPGQQVTVDLPFLEDEIAYIRAKHYEVDLQVPEVYHFLNSIYTLPHASDREKTLARQAALAAFVAIDELVNEKVLDAHTAAIAGRIGSLKQVLELLLAVREEIPAEIRRSVFDSVLAASIPQLRESPQFPTDWIEYVLYPLAHITNRDVDQHYPLPERNLTAISELAYLDIFEGSNIGSFQFAFSLAIANGRWSQIAQVGWVLFSALHSNALDIHEDIVDSSAALLTGEMNLVDWRAKLTTWDEAFTKARGSLF